MTTAQDQTSTGAAPPPQLAPLPAGAGATLPPLRPSSGAPMRQRLLNPSFNAGAPPSATEQAAQGLGTSPQTTVAAAASSPSLAPSGTPRAGVAGPGAAAEPPSARLRDAPATPSHQADTTDQAQLHAPAPGLQGGPAPEVPSTGAAIPAAGAGKPSRRGQPAAGQGSRRQLDLPHPPQGGQRRELPVPALQAAGAQEGGLRGTGAAKEYVENYSTGQFYRVKGGTRKPPASKSLDRAFAGEEQGDVAALVPADGLQRAVHASNRTAGRVSEGLLAGLAIAMLLWVYILDSSSSLPTALSSFLSQYSEGAVAVSASFFLLLVMAVSHTSYDLLCARGRRHRLRAKGAAPTAVRAALTIALVCYMLAFLSSTIIVPLEVRWAFRQEADSSFFTSLSDSDEGVLTLWHVGNVVRNALALLGWGVRAAMPVLGDG
ncbi:unnamed protein product [Pedinophyceae sp. YPF-701]|nr:unnamed protein product [Pedinophyceae sp. YPF-701]